MRRVPRITLICAYEPCQMPFEVVPSRRDTAKYCSKRCLAMVNQPKYGATLADRFWAKVALCEHGRTCKDCCWLWQASKGSSGYGTIYVLEQRRLIGAHVVSFFLASGRWPTDGMEIMHHCPTIHTKTCVNDAHLHEGTHMENMQEMYARVGPLNQFTPVSQATRDEIVRLYLTGSWTYDGLGRQYKMSPQTIYTYVRKHRERAHDASIKGNNK
jgi:hypothetical protein